MTIIKYDLSGFYNLRDGGGLTAADGRMRTLRLLRSDQPAALDRQDADFLRDLPLSSVIDLRTEVEVMMEPSLFKKGGFSVEKHSIMAGSPASMIEGDMTVSKMYQEMLKEGGRAFAKAVTAAAKGLGQGSVIIHCTAGKDRTGITVALIQELLGVSRDDIVSSYALTQDNLEGPWLEQKIKLVSEIVGKKEADKLAPLMSRSPPQAMVDALTYMDEHFGSPHNYLLKHHMDAGVVDQLRGSLVDSESFLGPAHRLGRRERGPVT